MIVPATGGAMYYSNRFARFPMPTILKFLLVAIAGTSLVSSIWAFVAPRGLQFLNPALWLSLSSHGISHFFVWQVFTYSFLEPIISVGHIIHLFFTLYLLYSIGLSILNVKGELHLARIFIGGSIAGGLVGAAFLYFFPSATVLMGPMPAIYAVIMAWIFLFPDAELYLFLTFPMKARWLFLAIAGIGLFSDLAEHHYARFFAYFASIAFGYLYALFVWELHSPFYALRNFETSLFSLKRRLFKQNISVDRFSKDPKIFDFKTGQAVLKDDEFLDACLEKISRLGKNSLSLWEKIRLWKIHRKRRKNA